MVECGDDYALFKAMQFEGELFEDMTLREIGHSVLDVLEERGDFRAPCIDNARFYKLEDGGDTLGYHDPKTGEIHLADMESDSAMLHEMIHYYETKLEALNPALCEYVLIKLWDRLRGRIDGLERRVLGFLEVVEHAELEADGGKHGLLFLLKSYDLDIRKGYPLGTVMGYGMQEDEAGDMKPADYWDIPTSRINRIIDAVNRRYPKAALGTLTEAENAWYESTWRAAEEHAGKYGEWPVFAMGEIEYDDPILDVYGDG